MLLEFRGISAEFAAALVGGAIPPIGQSPPTRVISGIGANALAKRTVDHEQGVSKAGDPRLRTTLDRLPGYGSAISRNRRWPCRSKNGSPQRRPAEEDDHRGAGAKAADRAVEMSPRASSSKGP